MTPAIPNMDCQIEVMSVCSSEVYHRVVTAHFSLLLQIPFSAVHRIIRQQLTRQQAWPEAALKETQRSADQHDLPDVEGYSEAEDEGRPDEHCAAQDFRG